ASRVYFLQVGVLHKEVVSSPLIPPDARKIGVVVVLNVHLLSESRQQHAESENPARQARPGENCLDASHWSRDAAAGMGVLASDGISQKLNRSHSARHPPQ